MDLSKITFFAFNEKYRQVYGVLQDQVQFKALLDEARRELPIIDGLVGCLQEIKELPEDQCGAAFNRIMQDIHMVVTLWRLAHSDVATEQRLESAPASPTEGQLRLRRFGMN